MKRTDLAWLAGFFDGEGSIYIVHQHTAHYQLSISIGSIDKWVVEWFALAFGGNVHLQYPAKGNRKKFWFWHLRDLKAEIALRMLLPYLKLKRPQAELALEFRKARSYHKGQNTVNEAELILRESYRQKIKALNQ